MFEHLMLFRVCTSTAIKLTFYLNRYNTERTGKWKFKSSPRGIGHP